jgi:hypothetical protein
VIVCNQSPTCFCLSGRRAELCVTNLLRVSAYLGDARNLLRVSAYLGDARNCV